MKMLRHGTHQSWNLDLLVVVEWVWAEDGHDTGRPVKGAHCWFPGSELVITDAEEAHLLWLLTVKTEI